MQVISWVDPRGSLFLEDRLQHHCAMSCLPDVFPVMDVTSLLQPLFLSDTKWIWFSDRTRWINLPVENPSRSQEDTMPNNSLHINNNTRSWNGTVGSWVIWRVSLSETSFGSLCSFRSWICWLSRELICIMRNVPFQFYCSLDQVTMPYMSNINTH